MSKTSNFQRVVQKALLTIANKVDPDNSNGAGKADYFDVVSTSLERIADHYKGGGGGGGGGMQIIYTSSESGEDESGAYYQTTMDKTFAEIKAMAINAPVFVHSVEEDSSNHYYLNLYYVMEVFKMNSVTCMVNVFNLATENTTSFIARSEDGYPIYRSYQSSDSGGEK